MIIKFQKIVFLQVWRTYLVANEWNELQTTRKINLSLQIILVILVLRVILFKYYIIGKMKSRQRGGGLIRLVCYVDIAIAIMKKVCKQFPKEEGRKFWPLHKTKDLSWKKNYSSSSCNTTYSQRLAKIKLFTCSLFRGNTPKNFHNSEVEKNTCNIVI